MKLNLSFSAMCAMLMLVGFPGRAEAYLDPGTGSMVLQIAVGGLLAVLATTRLYWTRVRSLFRKERRTEEVSR
jgi:hypothetical protein